MYNNRVPIKLLTPSELDTLEKHNGLFEVYRNDRWETLTHIVFSLDDIVRLKSNPLLVKSNVWQVLDIKYKYIAMDEDGSLWAYTKLPTYSNSVWAYNNAELTSLDCIKPEFISTEGVLPERSLVSRPGFEPRQAF